MRYTILITLISIAFYSCKKQNFEQYHSEPEIDNDTIPWEDLYSYGGTLPGVTMSDSNRLSGSTWIIPQYRAGSFSLINLTPPDTLIFIDNETYTYNGFEYSYDLYQSGNVYKLDLYQTLRFGYINTSLSLNIFDAGEFYLEKFYYQDIGMNTNNLFITMVRL